MTFTVIVIFPGKYSESGNAIPNSFYFWVLERDLSGGKPKSLSKNPFLLDERVIDSWVFTLNAHVLGLGL